MWVSCKHFLRCLLWLTFIRTERGREWESPSVSPTFAYHSQVNVKSYSDVCPSGEPFRDIAKMRVIVVIVTITDSCSVFISRHDHTVQQGATKFLVKLLIIPCSSTLEVLATEPSHGTGWQRNYERPRGFLSELEKLLSYLMIRPNTQMIVCLKSIFTIHSRKETAVHHVIGHTWDIPCACVSV